jgi:hypothetical protein
MNKITVIISSCDAFENCWKPLLHSLEQCWRNCPWDIYIISNHREIIHPKVKFLKAGNDRGWASNLKNILERIESDWIIYLQEDYWLTSEINTESLKKHIDYCIKNNIDYLRLNPPFHDEYSIIDTCYAQIPEGIRYRLCLQAAIWNKNVLQNCLVDGWTGWNFEYDLEKHLKKNNIKVKSLVINSNVFPDKGIEYVGGTAVRKGRWTVAAAEYLKQNNFEHLLSQREHEGVVLSRLMRVNTPFVRNLARVAVRMMMKLKINI